MPIPLRPVESLASETVGAAPKRRVADIIVRTLSELGVDTFYGIPGGAIASTYDALLDYPTLRVVNTRHETGAVFMAMGHSRVGGSLPCVLMTSGPGITNAITGLAAAHAEGIPLIAIGGEVPRKNYGRGALQEGSRYHLDVLGMMRSVTKFCAEVTNGQMAATLVRKAVSTALSGRQGPVFISLPLDISNERVPPIRFSTTVSNNFEIDEEMLEGAARMLQEAERGLILVGNGARHPEAVRLLGTIAATLQMPVITTPKAKGLFPESDPLSLGVWGWGGHGSATEYLESGVDVLLCIGCGLGETGTNGWSPILQAQKCFIQVDIDAGQIGKNYQVDYGLVGPAHIILRGLASRLRRRRYTTGLAPQPRGIRYYELETAHTDVVPLKPAWVLSALQQILPDDTVYTSDMGEHTIFAIHYLRVDHPDSFIVNTGLGSMGSGIGAAIGAKMAMPKRPVVSICGDYGFQMHGNELATCVQHRIGAVFAVFNDARMRMVESGLTKIYGRSVAMHSQRVDFAALARAVGARGFSVRSPEDFRALPDDLATSDIPTVLDIEIDPASTFPVNGRVADIRAFSSE